MARATDRQTSVLRSIDWWTILIYVVMLICGWFSVCGASYTYGDTEFFSLATRSGMQLIWIGTSITLGFVILMLDDRFYDTFAYIIYIALLLLLFVTIFNPHSIKGSRSWLVIGPLRLQPAEFAKFATALALGKFMSAYGYNIHRLKDFALTFGIIFLPMAFIVLQRETGSALVYLAFFLVFYREGMPGSVLFTGVAMVIYFVVGIRYENVLLWDTPTPVGNFFVLLLIQIFTAGMVEVYCNNRKLAWMIIAYCVGITMSFLLFSEFVIPDFKYFGEDGRFLLSNWAQWDGYRLSQLSDEGFTIRKRATADSPWLGTYSGRHASGYAFVGDVSGGIGIQLKDFWQSYPSTIEIENARTPMTDITVWLWSPEAEAMDLRHYDKVAHNLLASYEDVQEGMSTPYGIARTSTLYLVPQSAYPGKQVIAQTAGMLDEDAQMMPLPEYLHDKHAFGIWSLPDSANVDREKVEKRLSQYISFYEKAIVQKHWYGFWNYGDIMHSYDAERHEWRYDVGGFAWDNTEFATPDWLWYSFLRTGKADILHIAEAMTRHNSEEEIGRAHV